MKLKFSYPCPLIQHKEIGGAATLWTNYTITFTNYIIVAQLFIYFSEYLNCFSWEVVHPTPRGAEWFTGEPNKVIFLSWSIWNVWILLQTLNLHNMIWKLKLHKLNLKLPLCWYNSHTSPPPTASCSIPNTDTTFKTFWAFLDVRAWRQRWSL